MAFGTHGAANAYGASGVVTPQLPKADPPPQDSSGSFYSQARNGWVVSPTAAMQGIEAQNKQAHWNAAFGTLTGMLGRNPYTIGGNSGTGPTIGAGPVWNPQQIDQQVNATRAQNDAGAAAKTRDLSASMSGRGFGSNSPLLMALKTGIGNATTATNTEAERAFRQQAAQTNAEQTLKGQTAQEGQYASRQDENIRRAQPFFQQQNALIAALAGLA